MVYSNLLYAYALTRINITLKENSGRVVFVYHYLGPTSNNVLPKHEKLLHLFSK